MSFKRKKSFGLKERLFYEFCLSVFMIMNSNQSETTLHANLQFQMKKKGSCMVAICTRCFWKIKPMRNFRERLIETSFFEE